MDSGKNSPGLKTHHIHTDDFVVQKTSCSGSNSMTTNTATSTVQNTNAATTTTSEYPPNTEERIAFLFDVFTRKEIDHPTRPVCREAAAFLAVQKLWKIVSRDERLSNSPEDLAARKRQINGYRPVLDEELFRGLLDRAANIGLNVLKFELSRCHLAIRREPPKRLDDRRKMQIAEFVTSHTRKMYSVAMEIENGDPAFLIDEVVGNVYAINLGPQRPARNASRYPGEKRTSDSGTHRIARCTSVETPSDHRAKSA